MTRHQLEAGAFTAHDILVRQLEDADYTQRSYEATQLLFAVYQYVLDAYIELRTRREHIEEASALLARALRVSLED